MTSPSSRQRLHCSGISDGAPPTGAPVLSETNAMNKRQKTSHRFCGDEDPGSEQVVPA